MINYPDLLANPGLDELIVMNAEMQPGDDEASNDAVQIVVQTCVWNWWWCERSPFAARCSDAEG
jgi:hypothetical protein